MATYLDELDVKATDYAVRVQIACAQAIIEAIREAHDEEQRTPRNEAANLRERLDQFEAYAITVKSALDDRDRVRELEEELRLTLIASHVHADEHRQQRDRAARYEAAVQKWREGRAHIGTPMTYVDQRLVDEMQTIRSGSTPAPRFTHWSGTATKPEKPFEDEVNESAFHGPDPFHAQGEPHRVAVVASRLAGDVDTVSFDGTTLTTIRPCRDCGLLICGGPTRCLYCAEKVE
jgi:hypothetical protein